MASWSSSTTKQSSTTSTKESGKTQSTTSNVLDEELLSKIMGGLAGGMTDEEIYAFAEALLRPTLNAELEAADELYEGTELAKNKELEELGVQLAKDIEQQNKAYGRSMADTETAALARGMGRSSYTLQTLANHGNALAQAIQMLTEDSGRRRGQIQAEISQAAANRDRTKGRLNADYATSLGAKIQELKQNQADRYNSNYMTAVSASMGQQSVGTSESTGLSQTDSTSTTTSSSGSTKKSSGSSSKKKVTSDVDVISGADPSVRR